MAAGRMDVEETDRLYDRFVKPLEREHPGEYGAVMPDGQMVLGSTLLDVMDQASATFGSGSVIFKVGARAVGKVQCLTTRQ